MDFFRRLIVSFSEMWIASPSPVLTPPIPTPAPTPLYPWLSFDEMWNVSVPTVSAPTPSRPPTRAPTPLYPWLTFSEMWNVSLVSAPTTAPRIAAVQVIQPDSEELSLDGAPENELFEVVVKDTADIEELRDPQQQLQEIAEFCRENNNWKHANLWSKRFDAVQKIRAAAIHSPDVLQLYL